MNKYEIKNQGEDKAEIIIYGIVTDTEWWEDEVGAKNIIADIRKIVAKEILVHIYSYGGSVFAGLAIYNALKEHTANVTVRVDSIAASIASVIAMSGRVEMPENAFLMIHNPTTSLWGAEAEDFLKTAAFLEDVKKSLITAYKGKTDLADEKISEMMDNETWIMAAEAVELGFADSMIGAAAVENKAVFNHFQNFKNIPEQVRAMMIDEPAPDGAQHKPSMKGEEPMEITLAVLEKDAPALLEQIRADAKAKGINEGAETERIRIRAVADQTMPGHEELIVNLMYDGKTTGPEAAVAVLQAERQIRTNANNALVEDGVPPVKPSVDDDGKNTARNSDAPIEEQAKAEWEKDQSLRNEFSGDFDAYLAFRENQGNVRELKNREGGK